MQHMGTEWVLRPFTHLPINASFPLFVLQRIPCVMSRDRNCHANHRRRYHRRHIRALCSRKSSCIGRRFRKQAPERRRVGSWRWDEQARMAPQWFEPTEERAYCLYGGYLLFRSLTINEAHSLIFFPFLF